MPPDRILIDNIVRSVLQKLDTASGGGNAPSKFLEQSSRTSNNGAVLFDDAVITGAMLEERATPGARIRVSPRAVLTPSARDVIQSARLDVIRDGQTNYRQNPGGLAVSEGHDHSGGSSSPKKAICCVTVTSSPAVEQLLNDVGWTTTRPNCPDDTATEVINHVNNRADSVAVVFAEAAHRVAMLSNRCEAVRAAVVDDVPTAHSIQKQMQPNVWCLDPRRKSYFELRQLLRSLGVLASN